MSQSNQTVVASPVVYPYRIKVSGLPFMLQGWNNEYYRSAEVSEGKPVYRLDPYTLYGFIPIIGVKIFSKDGKWVFQRECDYEPLFDIYKFGIQSDPLGQWTMGMKVIPIA